MEKLKVLLVFVDMYYIMGREGGGGISSETF